jgi:uridine kinase
MSADAAPRGLWIAEVIHSPDVICRYGPNMLVTSPRRGELLASLTSQVVGAHRGRRIKVAVDGVDGAGKSVLADELAERISALGRCVVRASVDGFHRPRAERYRRGRTSPEGYYRDSYDYRRLRELLLNSLAAGASGRLRVAAFDHRRDTAISMPVQQAALDAVLILDGVFLHRPELQDSWDFSIFVHVGFDVALARCARRDRASPDLSTVANRRYVDGQRHYFRDAQPWEHATVIVDNNDLAAPFVVDPRVFSPDPVS